MQFRKEKNFIVAYRGNECRGKWNILTNEYIGVSGKIVKRTPEAFTHNYRFEMPEYMYGVYVIATEMSASHAYTEAHGKRLEQLLSLGIGLSSRNTSETWDFLANDTMSLNKKLVQYLMTQCNGKYSKFNISLYELYNFLLLYKDTYTEDEWAWAWKSLYMCCRDHPEMNAPAEFMVQLINYAIHEKVSYSHSSFEMSEIVYEWYTKQHILYGKVEAKHNVLTNHCILSYLFDEYSNTHYDEILNLNNNCKWLYYEDENFIVKPLVTREDFHKEAEAQRNCVERMYMSRVVQGSTHVVAVRRKNDPDTPYITCEVSNTHEIIQYLGKCNARKCDAQSVQFHHKYQVYLQTSV